MVTVKVTATSSSRRSGSTLPPSIADDVELLQDMVTRRSTRPSTRPAAGGEPLGAVSGGLGGPGGPLGGLGLPGM